MSKTARKQVKKAPAKKAAPAKAKAAPARKVAPVAAKAHRAKPAAKAHAPKHVAATKPAAKVAHGKHPVPAAKPAAKAHAPAAKAAHGKHPIPAAKPVAKAHAPEVKPAGKPATAAPVAVDPKAAKKGGKPGAEKIEIKLPPSTPEDRQSQLKLLIARGKEQSFLTYAEVNDHLPSEIVDPEQIEDIVQMINDMGIPV